MLSRRASYDCLTTWTLVVASVSCGDVILLEYENTVFSRSPRVHTFCHTTDAANRIHCDTGLLAPMLENSVFGRRKLDHASSFTTSNCAILYHEKLPILRNMSTTTKAQLQNFSSWLLSRRAANDCLKTLTRAAGASCGVRTFLKTKTPFFMVKSNSCMCSYFRCCWPYWKW